jgi:spore maturation protein CgeB
MRILVAGSEEVWAMEKFYTKHLADAGAEVKVIPIQSMFYRYYYKNILHKLLHKAGLSKIYSEIAAAVKKTIEEWRPDVLWVFKGMEIGPELLQWARTKGIKLVNYNPDSPFLFSGKGSGNDNITASIGCYDLHLTYDRNIQARIRGEYGIPCSILPFGFELREEVYAECTRQQEIVKICFLGNPDDHRAAFITRLADSSAIDVYGEGWQRFVSHRNVTIHAPVYNDEFWKTLHRYRIQLNLMRPHNLDSHNMRSFEVPGVGAIGLFPDTPDHRLYFEEGKELFLYSGLDECREQAARILGLSAEEALNIRHAARAKSLAKGYTYQDRAMAVLKEMKALTAFAKVERE